MPKCKACEQDVDEVCDLCGGCRKCHDSRNLHQDLKPKRRRGLEGDDDWVRGLLMNMASVGMGAIKVDEDGVHLVNPKEMAGIISRQLEPTPKPEPHSEEHYCLVKGCVNTVKYDGALCTPCLVTLKEGPSCTVPSAVESIMGPWWAERVIENRRLKELLSKQKEQLDKYDATLQKLRKRIYTLEKTVMEQPLPKSGKEPK